MATRRGLAIAAVTIASYIAAVILHYPELGIFAAGGLTALLFGLARVVRKPNLEISRTVEPARVTRGDLALGLLSVHNPGRMAVSPTIGEEPCGIERVTVALPRLAPGATDRTTYRLPTSRRAVLEIGPMTLARQDPLGLWKTSQRLGSTERLWVHPIVHALSAIPAGVTRSLDGSDRQSLPHGSITFHALREYVPGDDLRHVHWRSSARTGTLMVRDHVDTSLPQVMLLLDTSEANYDEAEFEEAVEVAASMSVATVRAGVPLRLITSSGQSIDCRGVGGDTVELLDLLAGIDRAQRSSMIGVVHELAASRRGDVLLAVTGRASAEEFTALGALGGRFNRGVIAVVSNQADEPEVAVPHNLRLLRLHDAGELPPLWERVSTR